MRKINALDLRADDDLQERFERESGFENSWNLYCYELSACPGTKVGGGQPTGPSGEEEHLLTLPSREFDWASFRRWMPLEDQRLLAGGHFLTAARLRQVNFQPLIEATGMTFDRTQKLRLYVCRERAGWPIHISISP